MATLIIETNNAKELNLIKELLKQMRIKSREIDLEDELLGKKIEKGLKTPKVSRSEVIKTLGK
jgi:hypothetical protein